VEPALGPYKVVLLKEPGKRIEHSFEVDEYGKNSTHVKHMYDIKEYKIGSFLYVVTSKNLAYINQKVARIFIYLNICQTLHALSH